MCNKQTTRTVSLKRATNITYEYTTELRGGLEARGAPPWGSPRQLSQDNCEVALAPGRRGGPPTRANLFTARGIHYYCSQILTADGLGVRSLRKSDERARRISD